MTMHSSQSGRPSSAVVQRSRRMFLRGVGVSVALPWLESVPVWGAARDATAALNVPPKRFAALFMGCGVNPKQWWAKGSGAELELGPCLAPLTPLKAKINVVSGLFNKNATNVDIHPGQTGNILSGASLQRGAELRGGITVDQELARHLGEATVQPSMVLGCEQPTTGYHESNFSMAYSSHISWESATSPVPMEVYPSLAFDALFDNQGNKRNQSILDRVRADAEGLSKRVSLNDRAKLDEYLTSVREVEKRAVAMRATKEKADNNAANRGRQAIGMPRPDNGLPEDVREHMRLMCDIIAIGFQTDKTRIATLLLNRDLSGLFYPFLGVNEAHHTASHGATSEGYGKITSFNVGQLAYLATRLDAMPEGEGTVLDHSCLLFASSMFSGANHESNKLPVVIAGGLGGALETGRALDYEKRGDDTRKLCSLYLSILDRMDVKLPSFGDASERLAGF